jgi:hypothetical protein
MTSPHSAAFGGPYSLPGLRSALFPAPTPAVQYFLITNSTRMSGWAVLPGLRVRKLRPQVTRTGAGGWRT